MSYDADFRLITDDGQRLSGGYCKGLISSVGGLYVPSGGLAGQFLAKRSDVDFDDEWINPPTFYIPDGSIRDEQIAWPSSADTAISSDKLKFLQMGPDAVAERVSDALRRQVYLENYGGGIYEDNLAAFYKANNALASAGGGAIRIGRGVYHTTDEFPLNPLVSIIGDGPCSEIRTTHPTANIVNASWNQIIRDVRFSTAVPRDGGAAIKFSPGGEALVTRCVFMDHMTSIHAENNCSLIWMANNRIFKRAHPYSIGIRVDGPVLSGNDYFIRDNFIRSMNQSQQGYAGIYVERSGGTYSAGNSVLWSNTGYHISCRDGHEVTWTFSFGDVFDTGTSNGVLLSPMPGGLIKGSFFNGSWTATNGQSGVKVDEGGGIVDGADFIFHKAINNSFNGIHLEKGRDLSISHSRTHGNSGAAIGAYDGIRVGVGVKDFAIESNKTGAGMGFGASQAFGIRVLPGPSDDYIIVNNRGKGNIVYGLHDGGTGVNKIVGPNLN